MIIIMVGWIASCNMSNGLEMGIKQSYSLCPKHDNSKKQLPSKLVEFSIKHNAKIIDRGADSKRELLSLGGGETIKSNDGKIILITIENKNKFRYSFGNLGLKNKIVMSIRNWGDLSQDLLLGKIAEAIGDDWTFERVEGGVTDHPECVIDNTD